MSLKKNSSSKDNNQVMCFIEFRNLLHILISRQTSRTGVQRRNKNGLEWDKFWINKINTNFGPERLK